MTENRAQQEPGAVVWVDENRAIVAHAESDGGIEAEQVERGAASETEYLAHVVHAIGDRSTVGIVGPSGIRLALEREFVAINHRPDRLVGIARSRQVAGPEILARMRRLAA